MNRKLRENIIDPLWGWFKRLVLPGFDRVPFYDVITFFFRGFKKGALVTRASSIAFNFMLALLPTTFFVFTLIPFIPIQNLQAELILLFESIVPENAYHLIESTIIDVITRKSGVVLIVMFLASAIMSSNGIHALIHAFVVSDHQFETRSWVAQRRVSFSLLLIVVFLIALSGVVLIFGNNLLQVLVERDIIRSAWLKYLVISLKWIIIVAILFLTISSLYYLAPSRKAKFRFFSAGATLATILFIITSLGFSAYVNNFDNYNKLYGSMGTILVILLWLYLNSLSLLIGFELNASIKTANIKQRSILNEED